MIGICVGHSRRGDEGAYSSGEYVVSEWDFNRDLARRISHLLYAPHKIYSDYKARSYTTGIKNVAREMKEDGVTAAVELHFNSATPSAQGHEWLYWHSSAGGQKLANVFKDKMELAYPEMKSRGAKPRVPKQRGATFLRKTHCVAVIGEPFFGSNVDEWHMINNSRDKLARVYSSALFEFAHG
tara:strand:+ start:95 stop:643 length:549 start_codon:yes stop_codon:yes gene_type:complete